jgi:hypothetical protein
MSFEHPSVVEELTEPIYNMKTQAIVSHREVRHTVCKVFELGPGAEATLLSQGRARCSPEDNFRKEEGRKRALTRALDPLPFDKEDRALVWTAYLNRKLGPTDTYGLCT